MSRPAPSRDDTNPSRGCKRSLKCAKSHCTSTDEYLDIRKKIFPRFCFVSSVALLDMLANGTNPPNIMPYLGDCYEALANFKFVTLEDGEKMDKIVDTMIAKDGGEVRLHENFVMEGKVKGYLNRLTESMRKSLKVILSNVVKKAVNWEIDTPRHEWLFNYPAQLCITGTQIYWTDEMQQALEEYEGGQEDAVKRYKSATTDSWHLFNLSWANYLPRIARKSFCSSQRLSMATATSFRMGAAHS